MLALTELFGSLAQRGAGVKGLNAMLTALLVLPAGHAIFNRPVLLIKQRGWVVVGRDAPKGAPNRQPPISCVVYR